MNGKQLASKDGQSGSYGGQIYDITPVARDLNALVIQVPPTDYTRHLAIGFIDWNPYPHDSRCHPLPLADLRLVLVVLFEKHKTRRFEVRNLRLIVASGDRHLEKCFHKTNRACCTGSFEGENGVLEFRPEHNKTFLSNPCSKSRVPDSLSTPLGPNGQS